jgi:protein CpxP
MTKIRKILFGFMAVCVLACPLSARAETSSSGWSQDRHSGQRIREIYGQLGLTDDQKSRLEINKQQHRVNMDKLRQAIKTDRQTLREEIMKPQLDMPRIKEIHMAIISLQAQMEDSKLFSILEVRSILTPEQFAKFIDLVNQYRQEREEK